MPELLSSLTKIEGVKDARASDNFLTMSCVKDLRLEISRVLVQNGVYPLLIRTQDLTLEGIYAKYFRGGSLHVRN